MEAITQNPVYIDNNGDTKKLIAQNKANFQNKQFICSIVAELKSGKSTFINALLGDLLLPESITPETFGVVRIEHVDPPEGKFSQRSGGRKTSRPIPGPSTSGYARHSPSLGMIGA